MSGFFVLSVDNISLNQFEDFIDVEGFGQKCISAERLGDLFIFVLVGHNDADLFRIFFLDVFEQFKSVHIRYIHIRNDNVRVVSCVDMLPGSGSVVKREYFPVDAEFQYIHGEIPHQLILIDDDYFNVWDHIRFR